ncbi:MAG: TonB-dependent receptor, partial [bacterium]|nr:TonB-dependent receptor [bacterium]
YSGFNLLGIEVPDRRYNKYDWLANIMFRPKPSLKFIFSFKDTQEHYTIFDWDYRYSSGTAPVREDKRRSISLEVAQSINKDMSYEAIFSYSQNSVQQRPGDPKNPGKGLDPDQFLLESQWEDYDDDNNNGIWDPPEPLFNLYPDSNLTGTPGPAYTFGEFNQELNIQNGQSDGWSNFRFNDNGLMDASEGEPFLDLNGNGVWDAGENLTDRNGNGILDNDRIGRVDNQTPEPYTDGDSIIGEPFTDVNTNRVYDRGIDIFIKSTGPDNMDLNHNGKYDGPNILPTEWVEGIPYADRNGNGLFDAANFHYDVGEQYVDVNGNGKYDAGGTTFLDPLNYSTESTWHFRESKTLRGEVKMFRHMGKHEVKAGFALQRWEFLYNEILKPYLLYTGRPDSVAGIAAPFPTRGSFRDMFEYNPWGGTGYIRDKIEYGSMIASLGLRWDFFIQDKYDLVEVAKNDDLGSGVIFGDRQKISPRIGFSYPISDKAKVHFNYGHFFQLPQLSLMYSRNTSAINENTVLGNYNLDYQKTIQYSFGVKYAMSENYSVDFSGYFKDEFDKINSHQIRLGGLTRQQYQNSDYGRSRGVEVTIEKRGGGYVNGMLSYTYAFAFGKASQTNQDYLTDFELSRDPLSESALDNDIRHSLKSSVQIFVPSTVKPRLFGLPIPNGWSMAIETIIESGKPFTPSREYPDITSNVGEDIQNNSLRRPTGVNFDLRLTKDFELVGMDYKFIFWVENVFDNKNVTDVYSNTGRPDTQQNPDQLIREGTDYDLNPNNWDYGRQVRLGIEVSL